ncbi:MAG: hypothetical protein WBE85_16390 [Methylocella sp.]
MSRDRPPKGGGKQRQGAPLIVEGEARAAPFVLRHPGKHCSGAGREAPDGDFRPRIIRPATARLSNRRKSCCPSATQNSLHRA